MRILSEDARGLRAVVLHCFSGDGAMAAEAWSAAISSAWEAP